MRKKFLPLMLVFMLLCASCGAKDSPAPSVSVPDEEAAALIVDAAESCGVSVRLCTSAEELAEDIRSRGEQLSEQRYESRGEYVSDLMAVAGDIAYVLRDHGVEVCRLGETGAERIVTLEVGYGWREKQTEGSWRGYEKQCAALLLAGDRLVVLSDLFSYGIHSGGGEWSSVDTSRCVVDIYDISLPHQPRWMRSFSQSGRECTSLISEGRLLLVTGRELFRDEVLGEGALPGWWQGEEWSALPPSSVYLCDRGGAGYMQLGVYELEDAAEPCSMALLGCGTECLLTENGLYGIIPGQDGSAVYYLDFHEGGLSAPVCSLFSEPYRSLSELTGAGDRLCLLQDGAPVPEEYQWHRRFGLNRTLAMRAADGGVRLSLLRADGGAEELYSWTLGFDFSVAPEEDRAIFTHPERGVIGLPSEDGYTLMGCGEEGFYHILDCYSRDYAGHARTIQQGDMLYITDMTHIFTVDLNSLRLIHTLAF